MMLDELSTAHKLFIPIITALREVWIYSLAPSFSAFSYLALGVFSHAASEHCLRLAYY
jgi:hypothetical protein